MEKINKKIAYILIVIVGLSLTFTMIAYGFYQIVKSRNEGSFNRTITLSAEGKVNTISDIATVDLQVFTEGKSIGTLTKDNNQKMQKVIDFLKENEIKEKDIKTINYNLYPVYDQKCNMEVLGYKNCSSIISKYKLDQTIEVTIRDFSKIDGIMGKVTELGVNNVSNLSFSVEDLEKAQNQAKISAINKINARASEIEKATNVKIGRIISISENNYGGYTSSYRSLEKSSIAPMAMDASVAAPIQAGSQNVAANVSMTFELR